MELGDDTTAVTLFDNFPIRRVWHEERWFYSVIDCMLPLSGSPNARRYWSDLKKKMLANEQIDVYAIGVQRLPIPAQDGRLAKTDAADTETLLRLVQSVPSPNAEPFKAWLAHTGSAALETASDHQLRAHHRYRLEILDEHLHSLVKFRGVSTPEQHQAFTDANYQGLYDNAAEADIRDERELIPGDDIRDWMGDLELTMNAFQRAQAAALIKDRNIRGATNINQAAYDVGVEIRLTVERLGGTMPEDLPKEKRLTKGDYVPELRDPVQETDEE